MLGEGSMSILTIYTLTLLHRSLGLESTCMHTNACLRTHTPFITVVPSTMWLKLYDGVGGGVVNIFNIPHRCYLCPYLGNVSDIGAHLL